MGGDMYEQEQGFFNFVANHSIEKSEKAKAWLKTLSCPVIYADGTKAIADNVNWLVSKVKHNPQFIQKGFV